MAIAKNYAKLCVKGKNFYTVPANKQAQVREILESGEINDTVYVILDDGTVVPAEEE